MKVLVIGGGGREHAIIKKLKESKEISKLYAFPGNGGMAEDAECIAGDAKDIDAIVAFAKENKIDYAVVAPDDPLVLGAVDALEAIGIPCFGPRQCRNYRGKQGLFQESDEEVRYSHRGIRGLLRYGKGA